jgi:hypothetical protein
MIDSIENIRRINVNWSGLIVSKGQDSCFDLTMLVYCERVTKVYLCICMKHVQENSHV